MFAVILVLVLVFLAYTQTGSQPVFTKDTHSFANLHEAKVTHMALQLTCDLERHMFRGKCAITVEGRAHVDLDIKDLKIWSIVDQNGKTVPFQIGTRNKFGSRLRVQPGWPSNQTCVLTIAYETAPECEAAAWLNVQQTTDKKRPFFFTNCESILARTLTPCHDTPRVKCPFSLQVEVPLGMHVVASAPRLGDPAKDFTRKTHTYAFEQKVPVPSYLIAVGCAALKRKRIGPRSHVYAEPSVLPLAEREMSGLIEQYIGACEKVCGVPYKWGWLDVLVVPPAFAYGGMENPNCIFFSAALLAGDKSLMATLAHEVAHSWAGNLVTNMDWGHFWLNEGFTRYIERRVLGQIHGPAFRGLLLKVGYMDLLKNVQYLAKTPGLTKLCPDLTNISPDDAFSRIPYEKGSLFLHYLEQVVGGEASMTAWLTRYFSDFRGQSIDTNTMKSHFIQFHSQQGKDLSSIDWDHWLYDEGVPVYDLDAHIDATLVDKCRELARAWTKGHVGAGDLEHMPAHAVMATLDFILEGHLSVDADLLEKIDKLHKLSRSANVEILFRWLLLNLRSGNKAMLPNVAEFLGRNGRGVYVKPLYTELVKLDQVFARQTFETHRDYYQQVVGRFVEGLWSTA